MARNAICGGEGGGDRQHHAEHLVAVEFEFVKAARDVDYISYFEHRT